MAIPKELKTVRQWTYSFSDKEKKRPTHTNYKKGGSLTYEKAKELRQYDSPNGYIGFYVTPDDPYILVDIDHLINPMEPWAELPVAMASFIRSNHSYSEVSPSGKGLRCIYRLSDPTCKSKVSGSYFKFKGDMGIGSGEAAREAQVNFGPPWQTITENQTPFSADELCDVTLEDVSEIFPVTRKGQKLEEKKPKPITTKLPSAREVIEALDRIPLDQNPRVKRACQQVFKVPYQHYDFWVKVLMALHDFAERMSMEVEFGEIAVRWSRTDPTHFESEEDVLKHWRSFSGKLPSNLQKMVDDNKEVISYKSLFGIAYRLRLFWPVPKKRTKEEKDAGLPHKPLVSEYSNFRSMLDYYNINLYRDETDTNLVYVTGDSDIIQKYFIMHRVSCYYGKYWGPFSRDTLIPAFHIMCQDQGFVGISHPQLMGFIKNLMATTRNSINLIRLYFDTPYDKLPKEYQVDQAYYETSTFDKLFSCLRIDHVTGRPNEEEELYKSYYKKWLMGIIRNLYYTEYEQMNNCVLLLTGPEQIRKTSHYKYLLPPFFREFVAFTTHGFATESAMRDVVKLSATNLILVWDELEQFLITGTESNFKKIIDGNPQKIIDKYETVEKIVKPIAIYGATSNLREFNLGSEGSRRLFHIPVTWVDTDRMQEICWHKLINDLHDEVKWHLKTNVVPWLLTPEQLSYQAELHKGIRSKTNVDLMLGEVWDFDQTIELNGRIPYVKSIQTDKSGRLLTTTEVKNMLARAGHQVPNLPSLVRSLERMCGAYTRTTRQKREITRPVCTIVKGQAQQHQYKKWVMPPLRAHIATDIFKVGMT